MGLMDILNGMQNGPRGQQAPTGGGSGGMSPMMMALLGMLAYKAIKGSGSGGVLGGQSTGGTRQVQDPGMDASAGGGGLGDILGGMLGGGAARPGASGGGGLGDILGGMLGGGGARPGASASAGGLGDILGGLGGLLGGAAGGGAAGGALNGGLKNLLDDLQANGQGEAAKSWIGTGANRSVAPNDLAKAIGIDDIDAVAKQTGMPRDQVLAALSEHLPEFVNQLTPNGRLPSDHEASRWL
jgi:uncharacterized protein YidB (DUF937 family)